MHRQRDFLLLGTLAAAFATPALAQAVAPAVWAGTDGTQSTAFIPDFSGRWRHRRDHLRALAQRVEVDAKEVRIGGIGADTGNRNRVS